MPDNSQSVERLMNEFYARKAKEKRRAKEHAETLREEQLMEIARANKTSLAEKESRERKQSEAEKMEREEQARIEAEFLQLKKYSENMIKEYLVSTQGDQRKIVLSNKSISDLSPFVKLSSTTHLNLSNNQISDLSHLSNLTSNL